MAGRHTHVLHTDRLVWRRVYLEDELLDPGSLGQEVQHGETGVRTHSRHGHPVTSSGARADVVGETRKIVNKRVHPAFIQTSDMDSDTETQRRISF